MKTFDHKTNEKGNIGMKTFDHKTKLKYIQRAKAHRAHDEIVQGQYWRDGKGCCIGCLSHTNENAHKALEDQTGIPSFVSKIADTLFEGMRSEDAPKIC